jgi:hypothetical protein
LYLLIWGCLGIDCDERHSITRSGKVLKPL